MDDGAAPRASTRRRSSSTTSTRSAGRRRSPNNSTKQIELFRPPRRGVPCEKQLVYYGGPQPDAATTARPMHRPRVRRGRQHEGGRVPQVRQRQGLGHGHAAARGPHPRVASRTRPTAASSSSARTSIDHTPQGRGRAHASSARPSTSSASAGRRISPSTPRAASMEEAFEIKVRNHKDQAVEVVVRENLYRWSQWSLIGQSHAVREEGRADDRVPGEGRRGRRGGDHLSRAIHLVTSKRRLLSVTRYAQNAQKGSPPREQPRRPALVNRSSARHRRPAARRRRRRSRSSARK